VLLTVAARGQRTALLVLLLTLGPQLAVSTTPSDLVVAAAQRRGPRSVDEAVLRAVHNVPTLPQLARPSIDSRGPGAAGVSRRFTGAEGDRLGGEDRGVEGAVREGAGMQGGEGRGRRAKTRVMEDAEVALGALRKCEEQLQRELLLTTP